MLRYDEEKASLPGVDAAPDEASSYIGSVVGSVDGSAVSSTTDRANNLNCSDGSFASARSNVVAAAGSPFGAPAPSGGSSVPRVGKVVRTRKRSLLALVGAVFLLAVVLGAVVGASGGSAHEAPSNTVVGLLEQPVDSNFGVDVPKLPEEPTETSSEDTELTEASSEDDLPEGSSEDEGALELPEEFPSPAAASQSSAAPTGSPTGSPTAAPTSPPTAELAIDEADAPSATGVAEGGQVLVAGGDPECADSDQSDYRGDVAVTASGRACQAWDAQAPQAHSRTPQNYPDAGLAGHNHCRNPDGNDAAWCYTTDPGRRWEFCAVPSCEAAADGDTDSGSGGSIFDDFVDSFVDAINDFVDMFWGN